MVPLLCCVGYVALCWLVVVGNADVGAFGNDIDIAEVFAVRDVGKEQEVWVSTLVQYAEPAAVEERCQSQNTQARMSMNMVKLTVQEDKACQA